MRHVRTSRRTSNSVEPKSQLSIPGHLDLQGGTYRTDVPTTFRVAVQIAVSITPSSTFFDRSIDVSAAFLSGEPIDISRNELRRVDCPRTARIAQRLWPNVTSQAVMFACPRTTNRTGDRAGKLQVNTLPTWMTDCCSGLAKRTDPLENQRVDQQPVRYRRVARLEHLSRC